MDEKPKIEYQNFIITAFQQHFKEQSLGIGSYGAICKVKCDDLLCAAKIIHPTLFDPTALHQIASQREHRLPIRRVTTLTIFVLCALFRNTCLTSHTGFVSGHVSR